MSLGKVRVGLRNLITVGSDLIPLWKVITSKTSYDHAGQPDKEGKRRVFSTLEISEETKGLWFS